jgi:hypothetical protein
VRNERAGLGNACFYAESDIQSRKQPFLIVDRKTAGNSALLDRAWKSDFVEVAPGRTNEFAVATKF